MSGNSRKTLINPNVCYLISPKQQADTVGHQLGKTTEHLDKEGGGDQNRAERRVSIGLCFVLHCVRGDFKGGKAL